jgi:hypothetical protein
MLRKIALAACAAALAVLGLPALVHAYGACHASYTHVGPNGAYHTSETVARGPGGVYAGGTTTAYGGTGGAYHTESGAHTTSAGVYGPTSYGTYRYAPSYGGGAVGGTTYGRETTVSTGYGYIR